MMTQLVGEYEAAIFIGFTKPESVDHLLMVGSFQNSQNKGRNGNGAALAVLGFTPAEAAAVLKTIDVDKLSIEDIIREALTKSLK